MREHGFSPKESNHGNGISVGAVNIPVLLFVIF